MATDHRTPAVTVTALAPFGLEADLIAVQVFEGENPADQSALDAATGGEVTRAMARGEITGKHCSCFVTPLLGEFAGRLLVVLGVGPRGEYSTTTTRRAATAAALTARRRRLARLVVSLQGLPALPLADLVQAATEGVTLGNFEPATYKTDEPPTAWIESCQLHLADASVAGLDAALDRGLVLGECSNIARSMANEPGNRLTPRLLAARALEVARDTDLLAEVLDERKLAELGMGLLLGVGQGSQEPPRLIVLRHDPPNAAADGPVLALVGKGITFDTGGISIKPAEHMERMKEDMTGGASVVAAMAAISRLGVGVRCIGLVPCAENMPGGKAIKPGDVLTSAAGTTVEVINTDAEGRLVLGDAVWYARQLGATHLVDVATLTGACIVALGHSTTGLFGRPAPWVEQVRLASERAGDRSWPMPVFDDYRELLKSEIADMTNTGGRAGGAITGALFIGAFAGDLPWVHLDIAGTAWAEEAKPYMPKGPTGVAVRTLAQLALHAAEWGKL